MSVEIKLADYFAEIELGENYTRRACEVVREVHNIFEFSDSAEFFVCERLDKEGNRNVENLWIFDEFYLYEMKGFLKRGNIDKMSYKNVKRSEWNWSRTDLTEFVNKSTVNLVVNFAGSISAEMFATGKNCAHLLRISKEKFSVYLD